MNKENKEINRYIKYIYPIRSDHPHDQAVEFPSRSSAKIIRKKKEKRKKKEMNQKNKGVII